jgi:eukaryotic-like serine/threonine-protein kinase
MGTRFRIDAVIGTGAMGTVFRAKHLTLERFVALKVLHAHLRSDDAFVTRFHREARAASRLDHGNIMRVIDYGEDEGPDALTQGRLFIAMELLEGPDLFQVIQDDFPLKRDRIISIVRQLLSAVAAAHEAGIIHRDLKPENVMMRKMRDDDDEEADVVKVCDFGIAKMTERTETSYDDGRKLSVHGLLVGTPEYMSPEQARGDTLDARSDVYAIGIMLYQILTGKLPFEGSQPLDVALKQLSEPPTAPHKRYEHVDPVLETICLKAIAKAPEERYQTAREMRSALRAALEGRSGADLSGAYASMPPPAASSEPPLMRRHTTSDGVRISGIDTPLATENAARRPSDAPLVASSRKATPLMIPMLGIAAAVGVGYLALRGSDPIVVPPSAPGSASQSTVRAESRPSLEPAPSLVVSAGPSSNESASQVADSGVASTPAVSFADASAPLNASAEPHPPAPAPSAAPNKHAVAPRLPFRPRPVPKAVDSGIERSFPVEPPPPDMPVPMPQTPDDPDPH